MRLRLVCGGILCLMGVFVAGTVQAESHTSKEEGFVSLFDGKSLENWKAYTEDGKDVTPEDSAFSVEDGTIHCSGKGRDYWLVPEGTYGDCILRLEFKITKDANSGVFLRCPSPAHPAYTGFEVQIVDDIGYEPNKHSTGSIYDVLSPMRNMSKPLGEWNTMEITCKGSNVKVKQNGCTVICTDFSELTEPIGKFDFPYSEMADEGLIGVQNHGRELWFRNIRIKRLD